MMAKVENKEQGWEHFLHTFEIYDDALDEDTLYLKY